MGIGKLGLTQVPPLSMTGFLLSGASGLASAWAFCPRGGRAARIVAATALLAAAALWAVQAALGYWAHLARFSSP